jgi:SAM-dependent methyltransferase
LRGRPESSGCGEDERLQRQSPHAEGYLGRPCTSCLITFVATVQVGTTFPLWHGNAGTVPAADGSFDLAISECGASIWCDPYRWIPEAARLLRPGGQLIFLAQVTCAEASQLGGAKPAVAEHPQ